MTTLGVTGFTLLSPERVENGEWIGRGTSTRKKSDRFENVNCNVKNH